MKPLRLIALALGSIRRNAGRSALTMLGVVIGVASVVVMVAIGQGAQREIEARIKSLGTNLLVITPGATTTGGVSGGAGTSASLSYDDAVTLKREAYAIRAVSPVVSAPSRIIVGSVNWRVMAMGVDIDYTVIRDWPVVEGRMFDANEVRALRKVCVLGATVANLFFPNGDAVGQVIRVRGVPLEVIGVLASKGQTADGADQDDVMLVPYSTVRTRMSGRQWLSQILVSAAGDGQLDEAREEVRAILRETHRLARNADDDFTIRDQSQLAEAAQGTTRVLTWLLFAVASVSLVVGGIGIMNIMLVSVTERTREIGVRRALGARQRDVLAQFLVEAVVLSGMGGAIGAALGIGVALLVGQVMGWAMSIGVGTVALALSFSFGVGVFFGWYPARRAARLDPIEALRFQ